MKILYVFLFAFFICNASSTTDAIDEHNLVLIRTIGDNYLLLQGDSTSRILPIEIDNGRYRMQFESKIELDIDKLTATVTDVVMKNGVWEGLRVSSITCQSKEIVHSFEVVAFANSMTPCRSRPLPMDCYEIFFTPIDKKSIVLENTEDQRASLPVKLVFPFLFGVVLFYMMWSPKRQEEIMPESNSIKIGDFDFDPQTMRLTFGGTSEELSAKEADLLKLLFDNLNETVDRDTIQQSVWEDNEDYMGRTIDVHISKLRKRLEADPSIKIINIRGVGYRMVVNAF